MSDWRVDAYREWRSQLMAIERRSYSERLDATRACIIRSCMRSVEIELCREARENDRPAK